MQWNNKVWSNAFKDLYLNVNPDKEEAGTETDAIARGRYLGSLRSPAPANWYTDHLRETQRLRGAVYVALKVLGDQVASSELCVYKRTSDKQNEEEEDRQPVPRNHPLCKLLHRPNPQDSQAVYLRRIVQQLCLTGTSLNWRVDDGFDSPIELWSIPTGTYQPVAISPLFPNGAYRVLPYFPGPLAQVPGVWSTGGVVVDAANIVAIRLPHPLVMQEGLSPLSACDNALDTLDSIEKARYSTIRRGIHPGAVAKLDPTAKYPNDKEMFRLEQQLHQLVGGPERAGRTAVLWPGMELEAWSQTEMEVGWLDSWEQLIGFVLSIFGITKSLAFMSEDSNFAQLYASQKQFNNHTLVPLLDIISDALNHLLVEPFFGEEYCIKFKPKPIHNEELVEQQISNDLKAGVRLIKEIRTLRGLPLTGEGWENERAFIGNRGTKVEDPDIRYDPEGTPEEEQPQRPDNTAGEGSQPPRDLAKRWGFVSTNGNGQH